MDNDALCDLEALQALVDDGDFHSAAGNINNDQGELEALASLVANDIDFGEISESNCLSAVSVKPHDLNKKTQISASKKLSTLSTNKIGEVTDEHKRALHHRSETSVVTKSISKTQNTHKVVLKSATLTEMGTVQTEALVEEMARMQKKMLELQKMLEQQVKHQSGAIQYSDVQNCVKELAIEKKIPVKDSVKSGSALLRSQTIEASKPESIGNDTSASAAFRLISDNDDFLFSQLKTSSSTLQPNQKGVLHGTRSPLQKRLANRGDMKKDLFGDSDSDWEMDSEDKQTLSEAGKDIKILLHSNQRNRDVHMPKFSMSDNGHGTSQTWTRSPLEVSRGAGKRNSLCNAQIKQKGDKNTLQCKVSSSEANPATEPSSCERLITEDYSKIRIVNPLISSSLMKMRMEGRKMISVSKIHLKLKTPDLQGDWVTIAVIVGKTDSKSSSTGKPYSIWRLSDLEDLDNVVSFFLFGEVHKHLWKTEIGTVIGVLNPSIMDSMERKNSEPAFTIKSAGQLMIMGRSKDLSWCIGMTKKGNKCSKFINKKFGDYCAYHVQTAYRKVSATRLELHGSPAGVKPKSFEQKIFSKDCAYMYGGQTFVPHSANKSKKHVTLKKLQNNMSVTMHSKVSTMSIHNIKPDQVGSKKIEKIQEDPDIFIDMISVPSPGSMNLVAFLKNKERSVSTSSTPSSKLSQASHVQSITANELLKQHQQLLQQKKAQKRKASDNLLADFNVYTQKSVASTHQDNRQCAETVANTLSQTPVLAKGFYSGQDISLDVSKRLISTADRAKLKAILTVKEKGGITQEDPNASKKSVLDIDKIQKRINESDSAEYSSQDNAARPSSHGEPPQKKSRLLGNISLNSDEIKNLMKARSKHKGALSKAETEREEVYFNELEKKEKLEEKMQSVTCMEITVITCKQCLYTAQSAKDSCKQDGHALVRSKAKKRFFMCKKCKYRIYIIGGKFPTETCRKCGAQAFQKTSMYKEKSGPILESEVLNIRGDEIKYLNSMSQKVYLQTVVDS